ncbi:ABC transporter permease [Curtobacterium sp. MCBD17_028]|uniref:ABC transporter permease n=1 Tax=Curtobacterium sp. MCBD17_028 TaxID=2175670 RepID=UPI000DA94523|nr:ABC transporter permease [Curtobacterium sp. MCBD17_028]PZE25639.1 ABC transporter permease [Curtobacterium sp. MCBD17_028]
MASEIELPRVRSVPALRARSAGGLHWKRVVLAVLRPLAVFVPVFVFGTFITFLLGAITGLNPAYVQLGDAATPSAVARLNHQWGLDKPFLVQYWTWFTDLLHGSLGTSWLDGIPVSTLIGQRILISLSVALVALVIGVLVGALLGALAAVTATSWVDRTITAFTSFISVMPPFTVGIVLVAVFAVQLHLLPSAGFIPLSQGFGPWLSHVIMPAIALSLDMVAGIARQLRAGLVSAYDENYVLGATVHGLSPRRIFFVHVLRNGGGPALALLGLTFPNLLGGAVVTETVFGLSGYGVFASTSALHGDVPSVQGVLVVSIVLVVGFNLLVNIALNRIQPSAARGV